MGFSGLSNVRQGLFASQEALRITSENIQNASTKGYARRVATFTSTTPTGNIGISVHGEVMRDKYLDSKVFNETGITAEWETKSSYYDRLMGIIDEPTDYSISQVTNDFFAAFQNLSNEPSNISYRVATIDAAEQFTNLLNNMAVQFENVQAELNEDIYSYTAVVNGLIEDIAELNGKIYQVEIAGKDASYLKDTLHNKINELAQYGDVTVEEVNKGKLVNGAEDIKTKITFGGYVVVNHTNTEKLVCVKRQDKKNAEDIEGLYDIELESGSKLELSSGKIKALIELRDGDGKSDASWIKGVVYYMKELNNFARTFAKAFNEGIIDYNKDGNVTADEKVNGYADGYTFNSIDNPVKDAAGNPIPDADGNLTYEAAGLRFFTINNSTSKEFVSEILDPANPDSLINLDLNDVNGLYENVTAKNISISSDILNDIENMLCSFTDPEYENDVQAILDLINFREDTKIYNSGDVDGFIEGFITSVGLDASKAKALTELHSTLLEESANSQAAYSDVSLDEEATFAVQYQYMYKACANLVNIYTDLYDSLISAL